MGLSDMQKGDHSRSKDFLFSYDAVLSKKELFE
jgi:hypothetical protein